VSSKVADIAVPDELHLLAGAAYLEDQLGPFRLELHPLSFLQPSTVQAQRMYERLCEGLRGLSVDIAWDLYCGIGLVAFYLSRHARRVYGIDSEPHHLELATRNASRNGLHNVEFRVGKVETLLLDRRFWLQEAKPDVIVVDPPRAGLQPQALSSQRAARPRRIAYFSCNVQSLVRDVQQLTSGFPRYRLAEVTAFDLFPQTNHVELLAFLARG
jgi:23S rRNA (uracil1939-C5)-methyltransferase